MPGVAMSQRVATSPGPAGSAAFGVGAGGLFFSHLRYARVSIVVMGACAGVSGVGAGLQSFKTLIYKELRLYE